MLLVANLGICTLFAPRTSGGTFTNGSFELPGGSAPGTSLMLGSGDTTMPGWTVSGPAGNQIILQNGVLGCFDFPPKDGSYHVIFNSGDQLPSMSIAQTFDTIPGEDYAVTFYVGRISSGGGIVSITASAKSQTDNTIGSMVAAASANGYGSRKRFIFTATTPNTTLQFLDSSEATISVDIALDNVSVSLVQPELSIHVSQVAICWLGTSNRLYQLQSRSDLTTNTWVDSGSPVLGTGDTSCVSDAVLGQPGKCYRVIKLP